MQEYIFQQDIKVRKRQSFACFAVTRPTAFNYSLEEWKSAVFPDFPRINASLPPSIKIDYLVMNKI